MDTLLQTLFSWQFVLFSLAIAAVMFVFRTSVEYALTAWKASVKESKFWTDLILPILPVILGGLGGILFKNYPYPNDLKTIGDRFIFGAVAGLLSTLLYRVLKALMVQKLQINVDVPSENNIDDKALEEQKQLDK